MYGGLDLSLLLYGVQVMTSTVEEKTNRINEVLVSSLRPIEAACRGRSGALIKTIKYERYETVAGKELLTGFSIVDAVSGEIERVRLSNFDRSLPPDSAFAVQGLRFRK